MDKREKIIKSYARTLNQVMKAEAPDASDAKTREELQTKIWEMILEATDDDQELALEVLQSMAGR